MGYSVSGKRPFAHTHASLPARLLSWIDVPITLGAGRELGRARALPTDVLPTTVIAPLLIPIDKPFLHPPEALTWTANCS